jgi:hypothetical protein
VRFDTVLRGRKSLREESYRAIARAVALNGPGTTAVPLTLTKPPERAQNQSQRGGNEFLARARILPRSTSKNAEILPGVPQDNAA